MQGQGLLCIIVGTFTFLTCVLLTPLARLVATRCGLLDFPDARRKMHVKPVPLAGGLAILVSVGVVLGTVLAFSENVQDYFAGHVSHFLGLAIAAVAICILGVVDDFQYLRGRHKLVGQIVAVGILIAFGIQIHTIHLFGTDFDLGLLAIPVTVLWLLGAINSLNLIDGMDGLLGSVGFIATAAMAVMAIMAGQWAAACVATAMAGALLGFLYYNFPPASVFLGDAGSMLTGLVVGVLGIECSFKGPATVALVAPIAILSIPFLDTLAAIVRRKLTGRSIYTTDRGHLHHCLLRRGLSTRAALLLISLLCLVTGLGALASLAMRSELVAIVTTLTVIFMLIATRLFGHAELTLFAKRIRHIAGSFLDAPGAGKSHKLEVQFQGTTGWSCLLQNVAEQAFELNLQAVRLEINAPAIHEHYHGQWHRVEEDADSAILWRAELPLTVQGRTVGRLAVSGFHDLEPLVQKIAAVTELMNDFLGGLSLNGSSPTATPEIAPLPASLAHDHHPHQAPHVFGPRRNEFPPVLKPDGTPASELTAS